MELSTGRVLRVNQRRVRNLPAQTEYNLIDPLPPRKKEEARDVPIEAVPILVRFARPRPTTEASCAADPWIGS